MKHNAWIAHIDEVCTSQGGTVWRKADYSNAYIKLDDDHGLIMEIGTGKARHPTTQLEEGEFLIKTDLYTCGYH